MEFTAWLQYGIDQKWAQGFCYRHESPYLTDIEANEQLDECIPALKIVVPER